MKPGTQYILTVNGGSSSIKVALFETGRSLHRLLRGGIERIGLPNPIFSMKGEVPGDNFSRTVSAPDYPAAVEALEDWLEERIGDGKLAAAGHRVVHGGPHYNQPGRITPEMIEQLRAIIPLDPEHLPGEIALIEAFQRRFPELPQIACFDTAFHAAMPRVARLLPIPRKYDAMGIQRYGFHGLSYEFLMEELERVAGLEAARGRVILAHLGNGSSLAAVSNGKPMDTSMGLT